jgi:hypothetical protein
MFYNISNHPSGKWSEEQRAEAVRMGMFIKDVQFPEVPPSLDDKELLSFAAEWVFLNVLPLQLKAEDTVMVQGEFGLTCLLVQWVQSYTPAKVVYATTERKVVEEPDPVTGETRKTAVFKFVRFRQYPRLSQFPEFPEFPVNLLDWDSRREPPTP